MTASNIALIAALVGAAIRYESRIAKMETHIEVLYKLVTKLEKIYGHNP